MLRAEYLFDRLDVLGRRGRLLQWALLAVLTALPVLLLMPLFAAPFDRDQGTYGVVARGWLQGAIPYRDLGGHNQAAAGTDSRPWCRTSCHCPG